MPKKNAEIEITETIEDSCQLEFSNESVLKLALEGYDNHEIATKFGVTHQAIAQRLLRLGIKRSEFNVNIINAFIKKRPDLFALKQKQILEAMTPEKIKKAGLSQQAVALGVIFDKERLERGQSTQNIAQLTAIIEAAGLPEETHMGKEYSEYPKMRAEEEVKP